MWAELMAYNASVRASSTLEEAAPFHQAQRDAARRFSLQYPQEMESLMHRAIDSDDLESLIYGCYLALESDVPSAETWVRDAEHRLSSGQQKMRPHPFATQQGRSTEEEALYAIHLLLAELSERQRDPAG